MSTQSDVDRGLEIREQIERLESELKNIETRLETTALKHPQDHVPLVDGDRDGRRWMANGSDKIVPVILTADLIVGEFAAASERAQKIMTASKGRMDFFFKRIQKFENRFETGKMFRKRADELLDAAAPNFITACLARDKQGQPKSRIVVAWKECEAKMRKEK